MVSVNVVGHDHVTLLEVDGRVDSMNADELGRALMEQIANERLKLVLDLTQVEYMSSAGLREIVSALKRLKRVDGDLRIVQPQARVMEVFEMAGLDTLVRIYPTRLEAVGSY